jgi:hypothetical protein
MPQRSYRPEALAGFFRLLDQELRRPTRITVIGGAAIGLSYDTRHSTTDIDLTPGQDNAFWEAVGRARSRMANPVPVQAVGIFQPPYSYEERCRRVAMDGVSRLQVFVPERHDLALMKIARGYAHDLQGVADMHSAQSLDLETLVARYHESRTQIIGSPEAFKLNFLAAVENLYGETTALKVEPRLESEMPPITEV